MAEEVSPLTDEERAELEALRAEKAARERAELEALRAERAADAPAEPTAPVAPARQERPRQAAARRIPDAEDQRIHEARERGARLMEPDDDLRMPVGQKIVLGVLALLVIIIVAMHFIVG